MAEKSIILTIGGLFKGEAFKKAKESIVNLNADIKRGAGAASQLAAAFDGLDSGASKSLQAISGMAQALVSLNATAILSQGMLTAINWYFGDLKRQAEECAEKMNRLKAAADAAFSSALTSQISAVNNEVKNLAADFDSITKQANAFSSALEGVRAASSQGGILKLQTEKLQAMIDAHTDAERQTIEAEYNLKIAHAQLIAAEEAGSERVAAATEAMETNQKRVANFDAQLAKLTEERAHLEESLMLERNSNGKHAADLEKQIATLKQQEIDLERKRNDDAANADVLELNLQKAKLEAANETEKATQGVKAAQLADKKLRDATHAREVAEGAAKLAAEENAAAKNADTNELKKGVDVQAELNAATKALATAEREYSDMVARRMESGGMTFDLIQQAVKQNNQNWTNPAFPAANLQNAAKAAAGAQAVADAVRNGARTVKELQRAERDGQRAARDAINRNFGQMTQDAARFEKLSNMNPKRLSKNDKDFLDKFKKLQEQNKKEKKEVEDQKAKIKEITDNTKKLADAVEKISDKLGLK